MKKIAGFVVAGALALSVTGCSKDKEFEAFMQENSSFASAVKAAGADGARKVFDEKKDGLKKSLDSIKDARGFQVKEETTKKLAENLVSCELDVCSAGDASVCADYHSLILSAQ